MKNVYIATSTRNLATYRVLAEVLFCHGFSVADWTVHLPDPGPDFETRKDEDPRGEVFAFTLDACGGSDLFIYLEAMQHELTRWRGW